MKADQSTTPISFEGEIDGLSGDLPAGRVIVIASRYHRAACDSMAQAAIDALQQAGFPPDSVQVARVPGAWELPLAVQVALDQPETIGVVAIGVVIRGETSHDQHINRAVSLELMRLGTEFSKPVGLALLTCNDEAQVTARTGGELGNKGIEAAAAVVEMLRLIDKLDQQ